MTDITIGCVVGWCVCGLFVYGCVGTTVLRKHSVNRFDIVYHATVCTNIEHEGCKVSRTPYQDIWCAWQIRWGDLHRCVEGEFFYSPLLWYVLTELLHCKSVIFVVHILFLQVYSANIMVSLFYCCFFLFLHGLSNSLIFIFTLSPPAKPT